MRKCPVCGYGNQDSGLKCGICGRGLAGVPVLRERLPEKDSFSILIAGLLLVCCGAAFFMAQRFAGKTEQPRAARGSGLEEGSMGYDGAVYSLDKMKNLRFLPREDKFRVVPLLFSPDDRVGDAAAKLLGAWSREREASDSRELLFKALLKAAAEGSSAVRKQAALEAGLTMALGFPFGPYLGEIRKTSAGLVAAREEDLTAAGFFLSSMAGIGEFSGEMLRTLERDPSSRARLYAACALARLGRDEGYSHLLRVLGGGDAELKGEAVSCMAYSSAAQTRSFLDSAAKGGDPDLAAKAKRALIFREQLAIIKK